MSTRGLPRRVVMFGKRAYATVSLFVSAACLVLFPGTSSAQSAFAGVVKDASGAVLPGVTIEAASPALIEGTRSVVTDGAGQYKLVTNVTAPENADMEVGALEESVTVTGQTPTVDVQTAVSQQVLPQRILDAVPTGGRNIQSVGAVLVGVTQST